MTNFLQIIDNAHTISTDGALNNITTPLTINSINTTRFESVTNGYIVTIWDSTTYPDDPKADPQMEQATVTAAVIGASGSLTISRANPKLHTGAPTIAHLNAAANLKAIHTAVNQVETDLTSKASTTELNTAISTSSTNDRNRVNHTGEQAISTVTGLQTALDGKSATTHAHASPALNDISDVTLTTATSGQVLKFNGTAWINDTDAAGSTVSDATTTSKGIVQLAGDLAGTAAAPTVPALANKANTTHTHAVNDLSDATITTPADGQVLTYDGVAAQWKNAAVPAGGGGGGQSLYDIIVAADGTGDHTTLSAALAVATTGQSIFVKNGSYTEPAITNIVTNLTIIGESASDTILNFAANTCSIQGSYTSLIRLKFTFTTGNLSAYGSNTRILECRIDQAGPPTAVNRMGGIEGLVRDNYFEYTSVDTVPTYIFQLEGNDALITANHFKGKIPAAAFINLSGQGLSFTSNQVISDGGSGTTSEAVRISAAQIVVGSNYIKANSGSALAVRSTFSTVVGNYLYFGQNGIFVNSPNATITGNSTDRSWWGIRCSGSANKVTITGNNLNGAGTTFAYGITCEGAAKDVVISSNIAVNFVDGVNIASTAVDINVLGNNFKGNATSINNASTSTVLTANIV